MWDLSEDEEEVSARTRAAEIARLDGRIQELRGNIETALTSLVVVWNGDGEVADVCPSLLINTLIAILEGYTDL